MVQTAKLSAEAEKLMPALDALSIEDQVGIADRLLASPELESASPDEVNVAWRDELRRRVEEIKSGKVVGIPAVEVFRRMHEKYG